LGKLFHLRHGDSVEQVIRDASEDGELDEEEGSMLLSVLTLDELQVQDIMTPRTDIACVSEEESIREAAELIIGTGHSRIPVYSGNRDNILGLLHAKDLLEHMLNPEELSRPAASIMREPFFVPETKNVLDLLQEFRSRKLHLAVILDEYGGTAGLVTIEDVLEQIVGDIEDEHDAPREEDIAEQDDGSYLINGRAHLDDIAEELGVKIECEEVDTLGGYLSHLAGRVPEVGEEFRAGGAAFVVKEADAKQIHSVRLLPPGGRLGAAQASESRPASDHAAAPAQRGAGLWAEAPKADAARPAPLPESPLESALARAVGDGAVYAEDSKV
jgi:magnesium and cobalt transporter